MADGYLCRACSKVVAATKNSRYRTHKNADGVNCELSSEEIPGDLLAQTPSDTKTAGVPEEGKDFAKCPQCGRNVKLTRLGYFPKHDTTLYGGEQCSTTGVRAFQAGGTQDVPLPGDSLPEEGVNRALRPKVSNQMEVEQAKPKGVPLALPAGASASSESVETGRPVGAAATVSEDASTPDWSREPPEDLEEPARSNLIRQPHEPTTWGSVPVAASSGASTETNSPESATTSEPSRELSTGTSPGPFRLGVKLSDSIRQPDSPYLQPPPYSGPEKPEPMGDLAKELATRIKETFYSYDNRKSLDNRSAQTTLGPSEIGTPCDRRLAMTLMGIPAVNPGGDGWAAFVGTCGHEGMAAIYRHADAGTGRYAVELPLTFPSRYVPRGTTDLLDRRDHEVVDWKFMGAYSLKKFKLEGPSETYRIQAQTYGLGAQLAGEVVRKVSVVGLPRAGASLDDMHVWTERFDRKVGEAALARVERIAVEIHGSNTEAGLDVLEHSLRRAKRFEVAGKEECRYCPFHLKGDKDMKRGCPGP